MIALLKCNCLNANIRVLVIVFLVFLFLLSGNYTSYIQETIYVGCVSLTSLQSAVLGLCPTLIKVAIASVNNGARQISPTTQGKAAFLRLPRETDLVMCVGRLERYRQKSYVQECVARPVRIIRTVEDVGIS